MKQQEKTTKGKTSAASASKKAAATKSKTPSATGSAVKRAATKPAPDQPALADARKGETKAKPKPKPKPKPKMTLTRPNPDAPIVKGKPTPPPPTRIVKSPAFPPPPPAPGLGRALNRPAPPPPVKGGKKGQLPAPPPAKPPRPTMPWPTGTSTAGLRVATRDGVLPPKPAQAPPPPPPRRLLDARENGRIDKVDVTDKGIRVGLVDGRRYLLPYLLVEPVDIARVEINPGQDGIVLHLRNGESLDYSLVRIQALAAVLEDRGPLK